MWRTGHGLPTHAQGQSQLLCTRYMLALFLGKCWQSRKLGRLARPKHTVWVCWKHLAEATVRNINSLLCEWTASTFGVEFEWTMFSTLLTQAFGAVAKKAVFFHLEVIWNSNGVAWGIKLDKVELLYPACNLCYFNTGFPTEHGRSKQLRTVNGARPSAGFAEEAYRWIGLHTESLPKTKLLTKFYTHTHTHAHS